MQRVAFLIANFHEDIGFGRFRLADNNKLVRAFFPHHLAAGRADIDDLFIGQGKVRLLAGIKDRKAVSRAVHD